MSYTRCPDCGERVYSLGCTWCNEEAYIAQQETLTREERYEIEAHKGDKAIAAQDKQREWPQADNE